ncbi:uncharacterized protein A4U43_C05F1130 [Asparagus officinalis]|uniref:Acyl carrier protein n=1 Tax=Asparagus officinalis TaxID=4686 RepID=A0A5P1EPG0_ASPOF|nr:acyl carrier protein 1, chloroplastic-like [Asparagus officinalis]ONK67543.1 uncharacterized protein A4U43_C05F1130 [Asparagus officinalis]
MASVTGSAINIAAPTRSSRRSQVDNGFPAKKLVSFSSQKSFPSVRLRHLQICCAAKQETVEKVCEIVKSQLALTETPVTGESKLTDLGADSLDTVEIVMGLEEAFDISVEEDNAQNITTVQEAADLIEELVEAKSSSS